MNVVEKGVYTWNTRNYQNQYNSSGHFGYGSHFNSHAWQEHAELMAKFNKTEHVHEIFAKKFKIFEVKIVSMV